MSVGRGGGGRVGPLQPRGVQGPHGPLSVTVQYEIVAFRLGFGANHQGPGFSSHWRGERGRMGGGGRVTLVSHGQLPTLTIVRCLLLS